MCMCDPSIRTPYCGKPGCEWPTTKETAYIPLDNKVITVKDLLDLYNSLSDEIMELTTSLKAIRGGGGNDNWENGIRNDTRKSVQLLYDELMAKRMEKTVLGLSYVYGLDNRDIDNLNHGRSFTINKYPDVYQDTARTRTDGEYPHD